MKKKVFIGAFCLAMTSMSAVVVNHFCNNKVQVSELTLQNVEALSEGDTSGLKKTKIDVTRAILKMALGIWHQFVQMVG